jgi:hypothetical protein
MGSFGFEPILKVLQGTPGLEAKPFYQLQAAMLAPCQAVVLPQPKEPTLMSPEVREALRRFVERGGLLVVTHDAVGFRRFSPVLPEVCPGGTERIEDQRWRLAVALPGAPDLQPNQTYQHTFYDHIILATAGSTQIVATDEAGRPLVVQGAAGRGRYCAVGLALGVGPGDLDVPLSVPEAQLLRGLLLSWKPG